MAWDGRDDPRSAPARGVLETDLEGRLTRALQVPDGWPNATSSRPLDALLHPDDFDSTVVGALAEGSVERVRLECRLRPQDGEVRQGLCFGARSPVARDRLIFVVEDITRLLVSAELAGTPALKDARTHLPSRRLHDDRLRHALAAGEDQNAVTAVMRILVRPRAGSCGSLGVEEPQLASRIVAALPAAATVTRMGPAEFSVVLPRLQSGEAEVAAALRRVRTGLGRGYEVAAGWTLAARGQRADPAGLVRRSALLMYRSLSQGGRPVPIPGAWLGRVDYRQAPSPPSTWSGCRCSSRRLWLASGLQDRQAAGRDVAPSVRRASWRRLRAPSPCRPRPSAAPPD